MGDLSKLKIAIGQPELCATQPSRNVKAREHMLSQAVDAGADLLVLPGSIADDRDVHIVALNDSRIDIVGNTVVLEAAGESYRIGLGAETFNCDFDITCDIEPWTIASKAPEKPERPRIALRPVGMRNAGKKVLCFDGASSAYGPNGQLVCRLRDDFDEDFALVTLTEPSGIADGCENKLLAGIVKTIRRFDEQVLPYGPRWVIGLSGGIDSSVVAALLTLALGSKRVIAYNLASRFNTQATRDNAQMLSKSLGIELRNGSISDLVAATELVVESYGYGGPDGEAALSGVVLENVQARARGNLLSTFAALEGGIVVNNGNRVEAALGYATLYGDAIGALAPIGDVLKSQLFDLARSINGQPGCEIIPENLLPLITEDGLEWQTMPSAELSDNQRDPMKWMYHDWLIDRLLDGDNLDDQACLVLEAYLADKLKSSDAAKWVSFYGLDDPRAFLEDFDWIITSMRRNVFKRIQSPPVITLANHASVHQKPETQGVTEPSERYVRLHERIAQCA